ncbi:acetyltransferase (GNAT) family protein [Sarocladium implicatum]|nr:acetyltransferase (GNAT) family protein [Sarocladium implicatum]
MTLINIRRATLADLDDIARVHADALEPFARFSEGFYGQNPRDVLPSMTKHSFANQQNIFSVAVDRPLGQVVGFLRYKVVDPGAPPAEPIQTLPLAGLRHKKHLEDIWRRFNDPREAQQDALYEKCHKGRRHIYIAHLMVDPKHQRRGIGRKLLQSALDLARFPGPDGVDCE